jgi:hypothetical protein
VRFFLDNCLSPRYAESLHILSDRDGHEVTHLKDKFERDVRDPVWIRKLGEEKEWVIVSGDTRIIRTPQLKAEWLASGLTAFFLSPRWMHAKYWPQIGMLLRWWPKILEQSALVERGAGFEVPYQSPGRLKVIR